MVRSITKPKQPEGILHMKIPTNQETPQWESIYEPRQLKEQVLNQHHKHFSQAAGTVLTCNPLRTLINDECTSESAKQILEGTADIDSLQINEYIKDLL